MYPSLFCLFHPHTLPIPFHTYCLFLSFPSRYVFASPVLTPPESEKADSEDRVSLKVRSHQFFSSFTLFFLVPIFVTHEEHNVNNLCLFFFFLSLFNLNIPSFVRLQREQRFTPSTPMLLSTSFFLKRRTTWSYSQFCFVILHTLYCAYTVYKSNHMHGATACARKHSCILGGCGAWERMEKQLC